MQLPFSATTPEASARDAIPGWQFAAVLSASPDLILLVGADGRYRYANAAVLDAMGLTLEEVVGKSWRELGFRPEVMEPFERELREVMTTGQPTRGQSYFPTRRGMRLYDYHLSPLVSPGGTLEGLACTARDVTELLIANRKLRENRERFKGAFQVSGIGMALVALDGTMFKVNPAVCRLMGYTEAELTGMNFQAITHPDDLDRDLAYLKQLTAGEIESYQMVKRYIHRSGEIRWAQLTVSMVRDEEGVPLYSVAQVEDVTRQKVAEAELERRQHELEQANARLRQADRFKDEFISVVAHELKSPLTILKGFSVLLENQSLGPLNDEQRRAMRQMRSGTDLLTNQVNDLLDMSLMQAGHFTLNVAPVSFAALVDRSLELLALRASQKDMHLQVAIPEDLPPIAVDEKRIGQVLHNLIHNAIKFTPQGGCISVNAHLQGDALRCEVVDSGPGIAPQDIPRLFKRFSQLAGPFQGVSGSGLGLSISKSLVEAHGGVMGVESEGEGKGSTFWFSLPL